MIVWLWTLIMAWLNHNVSFNIFFFKIREFGNFERVNATFAATAAIAATTAALVIVAIALWVQKKKLE